MSKFSLDKFLALVARSSLVEPDRLAHLVNDWKSRASLAQLDGAQECANHLVETGLLTAWQANKLLEGRHRGFYLGKYKLLDHLGSGGMSSVYLAEHTLMQRLVAIKVLPQQRVSDSSYLARFHLEGQCTAALDHANIVRAYDLNNQGKIHYLVMEYIEGRDLRAVVSHGGRLEVHTAADTIAQAAAGLEHAHQAGLVHRDIKPANLLVDRQGTVKILDMGLAKFNATRGIGAQLARDEHVLGTADYLAPEQVVDSNAVDRRADVYSLGCTLYFLLTGQPPFAFGSPLQRMAAHQRQSPPSLLSLRPDVPQGLVAICQRMMEKSPANRYQTAAEAHDALAAWLSDEAAAGRVGKRAEAAVDHVVGGAPCDRAGSKINLVTDSHPKLHTGPPDGPHAGSPFADTDSSMHGATEKIPAQRLDAAAASQSHVLHSELLRFGGFDVERPADGPLPPPIALPPAPSPPVAVRAVQPTPFGTPSGAGQFAAAGEAMPTVHRTRRSSSATSRRRSGARWPSILVLTGLILTAVLLAIFALAG